MSNVAAATAAAATPPAPPPAKSRKKLIIILAAAAAVLLLAVGGGAFYVLSKKKAVAAEEEGGEEIAQVDTGKSEAAGKHDPKALPVFAPLEPFTVNLADREAERYAQVAVTLQLDDAKTADQIKIYMPAIRNNILMVLAHKTSAQILGAEGKAQLAGEIQRATSRALGVAVSEPVDEIEEAGDAPKKKKKKAPAPALPVVAVHFSNFIVQ